jgi:diaminohydroxyphosphoribosylaminopyrimidine deaminase/5-amino-6-(5-phosphoribosylamino)uracil reductase
VSDSPEDAVFMRAAILEAKKALGRTGPNPIVGAVLVKDGDIVARGYHRKAGEPHAEINALKDAAANGVDASACTLYSTLEPCSHHGRTAPCATALIDARVRRVVYGCQDPNPIVAGRGLRMLREARVEVVGPVLEEDARALIRDFALSMAEERPYVIVKAGMTLDARVATRSGESKWITSEAARARGHQLRAEVQAIAVGVGTVLADDPLLTARGNGPDPVRVVLDTTLRTPPKKRVVPGTIFVCKKTASLAKERALVKAGATVLRATGDRVDVKKTLQMLYRTRGIMRLLVEGGPRLVGSLVDAGLCDELVLFVAPTLVGGAAPSFVAGKGVATLRAAPRFRFLGMEQIDGDLMLRYVRADAG